MIRRSPGKLWSSSQALGWQGLKHQGALYRERKNCERKTKDSRKVGRKVKLFLFRNKPRKCRLTRERQCAAPVFADRLNSRSPTPQTPCINVIARCIENKQVRMTTPRCWWMRHGFPVRPPRYRSDFCPTCGSPLPNLLGDTPRLWLPAGPLENGADLHTRSRDVITGTPKCLARAAGRARNSCVATCLRRRDVWSVVIKFTVLHCA
ncbi:MAG: hypothetical protein JWL65_1364 [Gammaproteobacteria bacterium]|nr:hypothetical protein [Gammaproteobacteria bacterium]